MWLMENADTPIRFNLSHRADDKKLLLKNSEVADWFSRLTQRASDNEIGKVHGSHDYRMENILGKCWILGLSKNIRPFSENMVFLTEFLNRHIETNPSEVLSFGKLYHYRDYEKVLGCFLPLLGYQNESSIMHITRRRINALYEFTRQKRYDIYVDGSKLKGVKKDWQPYIINPDLYADGHIALPDMHDLILFAGMYDILAEDEKQKIEVVVQWLFGEQYNTLYRRYGYFYVPGGAYLVKAIIFKPNLLNFKEMSFDKGDLASLLFTLFVLSHFQSAKKSEWFSFALDYLEQYKNQESRYQFPPHMIAEKPDCFVIGGGHMNVGENKKVKHYHEIISTYWVARIYRNLNNSIERGI